MASVASLVVSLIAETADFVAGMRQGQDEVRSLSRTVTLAKSNIESFNNSITAIGEVGEELRGISTGSAGVDDAFSRVAESATIAGTAFSVATAKASALHRAWGALKAIGTKPTNLFSLAALGAGLAGKKYFDDMTEFWDDWTKRDSVASDHYLNHLDRLQQAQIARDDLLKQQRAAARERAKIAQEELNRALAPADALLERQRISAEDQKLSPFQIEMDERQAAIAKGQPFQRRTDADYNVISAGAKAAAEMERSLTGAWVQNKITTDTFREYINLAREAAENQARAQNQADAEQTLVSLRQQYANLGKSSLEVREQELRAMGLQGEKLKEALGLLKQIEDFGAAEQETGRLKRMAEQIKEDLLTPMEVLEQKIKDIEAAQVQGFLTAAQAAQAIDKARQGVDSTAAPRDRQQPGALLFGSSAAFQRESNSGREQMVEELKKQTGFAQAIAANTRMLNDKTTAVDVISIA